MGDNTRIDGIYYMYVLVMTFEPCETTLYCLNDNICYQILVPRTKGHALCIPMFLSPNVHVHCTLYIYMSIQRYFLEVTPVNSTHL